MKWSPSMALLVPALGLGTALAPVTARSAVYLSVEQAQHDMFGTTPLQRFPVLLTSQQQDQLRDASSVSLPFRGDRVWKAADGGWFIVDEVVGKHEMITYAIAIGGDGAVRRVEVLEYRESYGQEVADAKWLHQFDGKNAASTLKLGKDIDNISGATLSSKHITDGVKRVVTMVALVLKHA